MPGAADLPVVVIGCGMSGLLTAIRLREAGFPFVVIEKNEGPGGTWWENTYPGGPRRRLRRLHRQGPRGDAAQGLGITAYRTQLLPQRRGRGHRAQPLPPRRLLERDQRTGPGRVRNRLSRDTTRTHDQVREVWSAGCERQRIVSDASAREGRLPV
ncbi:FAD-dependent oxidoreductase [Nocardia nova]|uniref:FAD-dependent oxidoreductase n=1 Tax=Nocardia nova TaxID=37330 RepID=A0A2T2YTP2_9NOCA|nr:FAD-dependent oxidoreductase [Nocardia nova]